jgi:hypothetical protein
VLSFADRFARGIALVAVLALGACSGGTDSLENQDSVTLQFGDAVNTNKALQTIDPWPRAVAETRLTTSGQRSAAAGERYRTGMILPPVPATTNAISSAAPAPTAPAGTTAR